MFCLMSPLLVKSLGGDTREGVKVLVRARVDWTHLLARPIYFYFWVHILTWSLRYTGTFSGMAFIPCPCYLLLGYRLSGKLLPGVGRTVM